MSEEKLNYQDAQKLLEKMPWPPFVQVEENEDPFQLTELDVNWVYCTMLNMKWRDATAITDITERKFLYNKSMMMAEDVTKERLRMDAKREELEKKLDEQISTLGLQRPPKEKDPLATTLPDPEEVAPNANLNL
jgi:hypothetical protein